MYYFFDSYLYIKTSKRIGYDPDIERWQLDPETKEVKEELVLKKTWMFGLK